MISLVFTWFLAASSVPAVTHTSSEPIAFALFTLTLLFTVGAVMTGRTGCNHKIQVILETCLFPLNTLQKTFSETSSQYYGTFPVHGTARYGSVWFTFGGFSTGYSTCYFFSTTSAGVPSDPYHYQNVTCKRY